MFSLCSVFQFCELNLRWCTIWMAPIAVACIWRYLYIPTLIYHNIDGTVSSETIDPFANHLLSLLFFDHFTAKPLELAVLSQLWGDKTSLFATVFLLSPSDIFKYISFSGGLSAIFRLMSFVHFILHMVWVQVKKWQPWYPWNMSFSTRTIMHMRDPPCHVEGWNRESHEIHLTK